MLVPLVLLALLATPDVYAGTITRGASPGSEWIQVEVGDDWPAFLRVSSGTPIVWHLDGRTGLDRATLHAGARIRWTGGCTEPERVEVVTLGPLALAAAVEEFVIDSCGAKLEAGLSAGELAVVEVLGSRSFLVREAVSQELARQGPRALRLLLWMRRSPDREVRARAEACLVRLGWER